MRFHQNFTSPGTFLVKNILSWEFSSIFFDLDFLRCACGGQGCPKYEFKPVQFVLYRLKVPLQVILDEKAYFLTF